MTRTDTDLIRYRNCLVQADAWLKQILEGVDLENTLLVITGDHGEELYEHGRLGHGTTLEGLQVHVPCLVRVPGQAPRRVDQLTSHCDLMPSLVDALGWGDEIRSFGQSIFRPTPPRCAVVAMLIPTKPSKVWAVVTPDHKSVISITDRITWQPHLTDLYDLQEHRQYFDSTQAMWSENFSAVARFHAYALERQSRQDGPAPNSSRASRPQHESHRLATKFQAES